MSDRTTPIGEMPDRLVLIRAWHGWTAPEHAHAYERLLRAEIFPAIAARGIPGYRGIELLRRATGSEVEFVTLMTFDSWEAIRAFAGSDLTAAVVPDAARKLLSRHGERAQHYELRWSSLRPLVPVLERDGGD